MIVETQDKKSDKKSHYDLVVTSGGKFNSMILLMILVMILPSTYLSFITKSNVRINDIRSNFEALANRKASWSQEDLDKLIAMKANDTRMEVIAHSLNRSVAACQSFYQKNLPSIKWSHELREKLLESVVEMGEDWDAIGLRLAVDAQVRSFTGYEYMHTYVNKLYHWIHRDVKYFILNIYEALIQDLGVRRKIQLF
jgi:hypothetical protein